MAMNLFLCVLLFNGSLRDGLEPSNSTCYELDSVVRELGVCVSVLFVRRGKKGGKDEERG